MFPTPATIIDRRAAYFHQRVEAVLTQIEQCLVRTPLAEWQPDGSLVIDLEIPPDLRADVCASLKAAGWAFEYHPETSSKYAAVVVKPAA